VKPLAVGPDRVGQPGLVDRHLAGLQRGDLLRIDIHAEDLASQLGEPRGGHQADVSGPDDGDRLACGAHGRDRLPAAPRAAQRPAGVSERAIASIWRLVRESSSVLDTQYTAPGVRTATRRR